MNDLAEIDQMIDYPPFSGTWVKRESLPNKLDTVNSLSDIAWRDPYDGWQTGITTTPNIQYWVRVSE